MSLFASRGFLPVFIAQFCGALNDNLFRNALFIYVTFQLATAQAKTIVALGTGLFILPYFLFSAGAGALADRYAKDRLMRILKSVEILLAFGAGAALIAGQVTAMQIMLVLLGTQAAFFGPVKYGILPELTRPEELVAANGYIEGATFLAILLGTILGGSLVSLPHGPVIVAVAMVGLAAVGTLAAWWIPVLPAADPTLAVGPRSYVTVGRLLRETAGNRPAWLAILGISWFWLLGAAVLSALPDYVKTIWAGGPQLVTFMLGVFVAGMGCGSLACNRLLRGRASTRFVPVSLLGMGLALAALCLLKPGIADSDNIAGFLTSWQGWAVSLALLALALAGGIFTVPLYTLMQTACAPAHRARVIAANNIMNSLFMVASSVFMMAIYRFGFGIMTIFSAIACGCLCLSLICYMRLKKVVSPL